MQSAYLVKLLLAKMMMTTNIWAGTKYLPQAILTMIGQNLRLNKIDVNDLQFRDVTSTEMLKDFARKRDYINYLISNYENIFMFTSMHYSIALHANFVYIRRYMYSRNGPCSVSMVDCSHYSSSVLGLHETTKYTLSYIKQYILYHIGKIIWCMFVL